jgi:dihydropyrimidinase
MSSARTQKEYDLVIKDGTVVTAVSTYRADVAVNGEHIAAIGQDLSGTRELDAGGKLVTPGAVDIHVHMQLALSSGFVSSDDFFTGTRAAALGGTTTIIDFVEAKPKQRLLDALASRQAEADPQVAIDYGLHMTLGPDEIGRLDQVPEVYAAGCTSFKLYMAYGFYLTDGRLMQALEAVRDVGGLPVVHAENWDLICTLVERNVAAGRTSPQWHPRSRPAIMEGEAAGRVIDIATMVGTPLHIFHVSCEATAKRIADARRRGLPVTGETCPQYLFLTEDAYDAPGLEGALPVCAPPLRPQADQNALWQALANEQLQLVTTDHCPFTKADKARGLGDFSQIPGGVPSIEMRLSAIFSRGVRSGLMSLNQWVAACCTTPAKLTGLKRKGDIAVGHDADLVIFDPEKGITLSTNVLHENVDWTPYDGLELRGWPVVTISRGEVIVEEGAFKGTAGHGRYIHRAE